MEQSRPINNRWALLTGASRGIGLELARGLIPRGYGLIIVARGEEGLHRAETFLRAEGARDVVTFALDLTATGAPEQLYRECVTRGLEIEVLVNNAGLFFFRDTVDVESGRVEQILALHIGATTSLCRLFARDMRARGRGYILNMSSYASWVPLAGLGLYAATKSYVRDFSYALRDELRESGVRVTVALPAGVATDLYGLPEHYQRMGLRWGVLMTPERVAHKVLRALFRGRRKVTPGVVNRVVLPLLRHLPWWAKRVIRKKTLGIQK